MPTTAAARPVDDSVTSIMEPAATAEAPAMPGGTTTSVVPLSTTSATQVPTTDPPIATTVPPAPVTTTSAPVTNKSAPTTTVSATTTSPPTTVEAPQPPRPIDLSVVDRAGWGARAPDSDKLAAHTVSRLTVHHAGDQSGTTGPARFRAWQAWHMDGRDWADISYHFIVGVDGAVYEGRDVAYRTDTGTNYDTTGHFQVAVEGNFEVDHPTDQQLESLARLLAWASTTYGVDPSTIAGHREHAQTLCPGSHLQDYIASGQLLEAVESLLAAGGVDLSS